jgi:hypothetical protein
MCRDLMTALVGGRGGAQLISVHPLCNYNCIIIITPNFFLWLGERERGMSGGDESGHSRLPKPPWKFSNEAHLCSCVRFKLANFVCGFSLLNLSNFREVHFNATFNLSLSLSL